MVLECPAFHPRWRVTLLPDEGVYFTSEREQTVCEGAAFTRVVPLIDGRRRSDAIVDELEGRLDPAEAYYALIELERQGCLCDAATVTPPGKPRSSEAIGRLAGGAAIVFVDHYLAPELDALNRAALRDGRPWMLAKPTGDEVWVGPLFVPGQTACWRCLADRLRRARPVDAYLATRRRTGQVIARAATVGDHVLERMAERIDDEPGVSALGAVLTYGVACGTLERHPVTKRPQCPSCGDPGLYGRQLERFDCSAGALSAKCAPLDTALVGRVAGITASIAKITSVDHDHFHVYAAAPVRSGATRHLGPPHAALHIRSAGSGTSDAQAMTCALAETVERVCGTAHGDEPRARASLLELGPRAVHPNACMLFSEAQFGARRARNAHGEPVTRVPEPLDPMAAVDWTPVWSLGSGGQRLLPTAYLYLDAVKAVGQRFCTSDTNGNAVGGSRADAIVRGFLELVERDSIAIWWYNRVRRPAIDLGRLGDSYCRDLARAYHSLGREYWVLDITADLGVPAFAAVTRRIDSACEEILFGFGAHLDAERAVTHAVTEMNQMVAALATTNGVAGVGSSALGRWVQEAAVENQPYLLPEGTTDARLHRLERLVERDPQADFAYCRELVERRGMELLVLDLTRPDIGLPAVRVIVPGLRPAFARFAPGRLFDVPVQLGWLSDRLPEVALNPVAFFL